MQQKRQDRKKRKAAFTLAEFLTVVAIVMILAGLSFVAVIRYQRRLRRLEMDQTAKEIFLAAQNHLTLEDSNGTLSRLLGMESGLSDEEKQSKLGIKVDNTVLAEEQAGNIYAVLYVPEKRIEADGGTENASAANVTEEIRERLLPFGAIDETVRSDGSYLIFYDPEAGLVREVWYSDRYPFVQDDIGSEALRDAASSAGKRERFTGANPDYQDKRFPIGYYASHTLDTPEDVPMVKFQAPKLKLVNDDILYAEITDPNQTAHSLRLFVKGETSGTIGYMEVNASESGRSARVAKVSGTEADLDGTYQVILDDVAAPLDVNGTAALKFMDFNRAAQTDMIFQQDERGFASFIPGENIYVYAQVFNNDILSSIETSSTGSGNSLFSAVDSNRSAVIGSFRHLENLDSRVSGFDPEQLYPRMSETNMTKTVTAMQLRDLTWKAETRGSEAGGYCGHVAQLHTAFGSNLLNKDANTMSIAYQQTDLSNPDQTNPDVQKFGSAAGSYLPVNPLYPMEYLGNTRRIDGLQVAKTTGSGIQAAEGTGGLFGTVTQTLNVRNLLIGQPVIRTKDSAGSVIGAVVPGTDARGNAVVPSVELKNVQVEYPQVQVEQGGDAGALIGSFEGNSLTIQKSLAENHFRKKLGSREQEKEDLVQTTECSYRIRASKGTAGGLIGTVKGTLSLTDSAAALYVEGANAGGLIGMAGTTAGTGGGNSTSVQIQNCYVGGHTAEGKYETSQNPGDAAGANGTFENLAGRYNVAAYTGGKAGGLAAQLPAASQVSSSYVSASVYTPTAGTETGGNGASGSADTAGGTTNSTTGGTTSASDAVRASAFIASYEDGAIGKLPSEKNGETASAGELYPGCYTAAMVNEEEVLEYADSLSSLFEEDENTSTSDTGQGSGTDANPGTDTNPGADTGTDAEVKENAYPYDAVLKAEPFYPMPTIETLAEKFAGTDASKLDEVKKLSWFLKTQVGDWVSIGEEKEEPGFRMYNENRLYVDFVSEQKLSEYADGPIYFTYSVQGDMSKETVYYVVAMEKKDIQGTAKYRAMKSVTDTDTVKEEYGHGNWYFLNKDPKNGYRLLDVVHRFEVKETKDKRIKLRFYLDNRTFQGSEYQSLYLEEQRSNIINGENITVKLAEPGIKIWDENNLKKVEGNSCFEAIEQIGNTDTYIAKISNSRNLLNLGLCREKSGYKGIKIQKAIQTDNILWQPDTDTKNPIKAKTIPYCEEIGNAYRNSDKINPEYRDTGVQVWSGGFFNSFIPIVNDDLLEYDGDNHTIVQLKISGNAWGGLALFQKSNHLTISNLNMKDPDIQKIKQYIAALIAQAGEWGERLKGTYLNLRNVHIYGDNLKLNGTSSTGGAVAYANVEKLELTNVSLDAPNAQLQGSEVGGLIGQVSADALNLQDVSVSGNALQIQANTANNRYAGGIAGQVNVAEMSLDHLYVSGDQMQIQATDGDNGYAGGIAGIIYNNGKLLKIQNAYVYGKNMLVKARNAGGGLVGQVSVGTQTTLDNSFFSGYVQAEVGNAGGLYGVLEIQNAGGPSFAGKESYIAGSYVGGRHSSYDYTGTQPESTSSRKTVTASETAGGLVGKATGPLEVRQSFSMADVYGTQKETKTGGLIGSYNGYYNGSATTGLKLESCYMAGSVKVGERTPAYRGYFFGQLDGYTIMTDNGVTLKAGEKESAYVALPNAMPFGVSGKPYLDGTKYNISQKTSTSLAPASEDERAQQTTIMDETLQGTSALNYPYPIWTVYEPAAGQPGMRWYVGDWITE